MNSQIRRAILCCLDGIGATESERGDGWWETSAGAEFGAKVLEKILSSIALDKICETDIDQFCGRNDYILEINHPSGKIIKILVPIDASEVFSNMPYGLNMVSSGHYT